MPTTARRLRVGVVAACVAWAALIVAGTFLASRAHAGELASAIVLAVYAVGSLICHQLPERSWALWGAQMPVCARCAGIYAGAVVGAAFALCASASLRRSDARAAPPRALLALAVAPSLLTLLYEWTTGDMPSHEIRGIAGVAIGAAVAWLVVAAAES